MGSFSIWHWIIVLIIVLLLFGTKRLGNIGSDLGSAIKNFKKSVKDGENEAGQSGDAAQNRIAKGEGKVVEGEATREKDRN